MHLQSFTRPHDFINVSSDFILKICRDRSQSVASPTRINIALSGGSTPQKTYESLAKKLSFMLCPGNDGPLKNQLHFYEVDERYVPATSEDSNQKMIVESFDTGQLKFSAQNSNSTFPDSHFSKNPSSSHIHFHFFDTSLPIKDSLRKYAKELPKTPFDLIILGIGPDGHTASLFPAEKNTTNYKALSTKSPLAHTTTEEFAVKNRLTMTFATILKSKNLLILLKNKPEILTELKTPTKPFTKFPGRKLTKHPHLKILHLA